MDDIIKSGEKVVLYQDMYCYDHRRFWFQLRIGEKVADLKYISDIVLVEMINNRIIHVIDMDGTHNFYLMDCLIDFCISKEEPTDE